MFERLIKLVRQTKVSLFIGAGFSIEANAPSVSKLKELVLAEFENDKQRKEHENDSLAELTEFFVEEICSGSRNELITIMKKAFKFTPTCMDDHKMLAAIPHFNRIFTTNYDTLLEDSYPESERDVVRNDDDCTYLNNPTAIFKVHGDFVFPDSVVITTNDYNKFKKKRPNPSMWNLVETEFLTKHILFIGYSLEDNNILDIIKTISKNINRNQKDMFLVAPNIPIGKQQQLKKMGVTYFNAVAKDFLQELTQSLEENISDDFRHNNISAEIYTRFSQQHRFRPVVEVRPNSENQIKGVKAFKGEELSLKLNMQVSSSIGEKLKEADFDKVGEYLENDTFYNGVKVPCIRVTGKDLLNCSHSVNGVVLQNQFREIIIGPAEHSLNLTIRIPQKGFFESVTAKCYNINNSKALMFVDCHIFDLAITLTLKEPQGANVIFQFDFKKKFKDCSEALKWIEVSIAFFSGEDVFIKELTSEPFKLSSPKEVEDCHFNEYKEYYSNLKEIELHTAQKFSVYYECTESRFKYARIVVSYLKHESVRYKNEKYKNFRVTTEWDSFIGKIPVNEKLSMVSSEVKGITINLNERTFQIPYLHRIFNECMIKSASPQNEKLIAIDVEYNHPCYDVLYSNQPCNIEFPKMKPIQELSNK